MFKTCSERPKGPKLVENIVNKANCNGDTPLHLSTRRGNQECTEVLLKAGAIPAPNFEDKIPDIRTHLNDKEVVKKLIEAKQKDRLSTFCLRQLKDQAEGRSSAELKHLLSLEGVGGDYVAKEGLVLRQFTDEAKVGARVPVRAGDDLEVSKHNPRMQDYYIVTHTTHSNYFDLKTFQCLAKHGHWWKMKHGHSVGFAARYLLTPKDTEKQHAGETWYFGDMTREEAEDLLSEPTNLDGSYLVRHSTKEGGMDVLTLKSKGKCRHYDIKTDDNLVWINDKRKFSSVKELIYDYTANKSAGIAERLSGVCKILDPLEDRNFQVVIKEQGLARK